MSSPNRLLTPLFLPLIILCGCGGTSGPAPTPTTITVVEGMNVSAPAGTVLPEGPTVEVRDQNGEPMAGVNVSFSLREGGGTVVLTSRQTDAIGRAWSTWILGRDATEPQRLRAAVQGSAVEVEIQATAIDPIPGERYSGRFGFTDYFSGELPVVISAPHGGRLKPGHVADRSYGAMSEDLNTMDLAMRIRDAIRAETGSYPHIIVSQLHRSKLDPNREILEAAQGDPYAERAWWEFQTFIDEASLRVQEEFGEGFYIDLHGHGHPNQRLELGYMLSASDLTRSDEELDVGFYIDKSSFRALGSKPGVDFADLIRGPLSLGTLLEAEGFPAVPSQSQPNPGGEDFLSSGYNTGRHGSRNGGTLSGVQIECNYTGVRDLGTNRQAFADALANVLGPFFAAYYDIPLAPAPVGATGGFP
jgi:hypothetical protein